MAPDVQFIGTLHLILMIVQKKLFPYKIFLYGICSNPLGNKVSITNTNKKNIFCSAITKLFNKIEEGKDSLPSFK